MAKTIVTNTKGATHTAAIEGLREVSWNLATVEKQFGSDGEPQQYDPVDFTVDGEATFENADAYNTALSNAEANLVIVGREKGGAADSTFTLKNCTFIRSSASLPTRQGSEVGTYRCGFRLTPGAADTIDVMVTVT